MKIDPVSLRLFVHVVEEGTLVAGAQRMHIVTSAASKRMNELEAAVGTQLLKRTNRGVEPTAAGVTLLNLARNVLDDLDAIQPRMLDYSRGIRGHVRVLASLSAISQFLPGDLASFLVKYPDVSIHFEERDSAAIVKAVAENVADVGVSVATTHHYELDELPYHTYRVGVLVPRNHALAARRRVSFAQVLDHPCIGLRQGGATSRFMTRRAAELDRRLDIRMHVESYDTMSLMVEAGLGIGIVPRGIVRPYSRAFGVRLVTLDEPWAARELRLYLASYRRLPAAARLLVDHLAGSA